MGEGRGGTGKTNFLRNMVRVKKKQSKGFRDKEGSTTKTKSLKDYWD